MHSGKVFQALPDLHQQHSMCTDKFRTENGLKIPRLYKVRYGPNKKLFDFWQEVIAIVILDVKHYLVSRG